MPGNRKGPTLALGHGVQVRRSDDIVDLLLFHDRALIVWLVEDELIRASPTFKGILAKRVLKRDRCTGNGQCIAAIWTNCESMSWWSGWTGEDGSYMLEPCNRYLKRYRHTTKRLRLKQDTEMVVEYRRKANARCCFAWGKIIYMVIYQDGMEDTILREARRVQTAAVTSPLAVSSMVIIESEARLQS